MERLSQHHNLLFPLIKGQDCVLFVCCCRRVFKAEGGMKLGQKHFGVWSRLFIRPLTLLKGGVKVTEDFQE